MITARFEEFYAAPPSEHQTTVRYAGRQSCRPGHRHEGPRDHHLLHVVTHGYGRVRMGGEIRSIGPSGFFLYRPGDRIFYEASSERPWSYLWVGFSGKEVAKLLSELGFDSLRFAPRTNDADRIFASLSELIDLLRRRSGAFEVEARGLLLLVLARLADGAGAYLPARRRESGPVERVRSIVGANFVRNISVEGIARTIGLSRPYLCRIFREQTGENIQAYLTRYRMDRAKTLLESSELSVREIGAAVGYEQYSSFERRFRAQLGVSPSAFRASRRGSYQRESC